MTSRLGLGFSKHAFIDRVYAVCNLGHPPVFLWQRDAKTHTFGQQSSRSPAFRTLLAHLDESGKYLGPLGMCSHNHDVALIGRDEAGLKTSAAAAYPPLFCENLARLIFSATTTIQSVVESWAASDVHPAEALSQVLLQANQTPLPEDILAVFELLPHTRAHPGTCQAFGSPQEVEVRVTTSTRKGPCRFSRRSVRNRWILHRVGPLASP